MIRRVTLSLNEATGSKRDELNILIEEYLIFLQHVINTLWNHKIFFGFFVPKKWYASIKTTKRHYHFNRFFNSDWVMSKSCRLRRTKKGLFLDVFFEKDAGPVKEAGAVVGLDLGFRKLAVLSDGQIVGKELKTGITKFYKRKKSHLIISELINQELKKIDFANIKTLVVEDLKNVKKGKGKKGKKGKKFSRYANRLLSHWAYHRALSKLGMLCEENRVQIAGVNPRGTSKACNKCGSRGIRRDERFVCQACGNKDDADNNAACNIRDCFITQGVYGPLPQNHLDVPFG